MNGQEIGTGPTFGLLVYGGLTAFAAYQRLFWFGTRERRSLHLAAAALFIALAHVLAGELAGAMRWVVLAALITAATAPAWGGTAAAPWLASAIAGAALGVLSVMILRLRRSVYRAPRYSWLLIVGLCGLLAALAARPHGAWAADARLEHALELGTVALLFALGYAVAARARLERRAGREAELRAYVGEALAADTAARAEADVRIATMRCVEELARFAFAGADARGAATIDPDWDREIV